MKTANCNSRDPVIDVMRGASIMWIVGFWHLFDYTDAFSAYQNKLTYRVSELALGIFMLFSGYLLGGKCILTKKDVERFYRSRVLRIYPPYLLAIGLFYLFGLSGVRDLAKSALGLSMFWPPPPPTLWFITTLMVFYLCAPGLMLCAARYTATSYSLIVVAAATALYLAGDRIDIRIVIYFPLFAMGVLLANRPRLESRLSAALLCLVLFAAIFLPNEGTYRAQLTAISTSMFALSGTLLLWRVLKALPVRDIPLLWLWAALSYAGYFMYLFHRPVYAALKHFYFPEGDVWEIAYLMFVCLPSVVVVAYCGQKVYDSVIMPALVARPIN